MISTKGNVIQVQNDGTLITNRDSVSNKQTSQPPTDDNNDEEIPNVPQPGLRSFVIILRRGLTGAKIHAKVFQMTEIISSELSTSDPEALAAFESQPEEKFMRSPPDA